MRKNVGKKLADIGKDCTAFFDTIHDTGKIIIQQNHIGCGTRNVGARQKLDYILASHQDPDIIASLGRWLMQTDARVIVSKLWSRFLPHLGASYLDDFNGKKLEQRIIAIEDKGGVIELGSSTILILPAHFLHSVGNLHFYDVKSRILFSGDMGGFPGGRITG
jgi:flavorubredoxin